MEVFCLYYDGEVYDLDSPYYGVIEDDEDDD